MKKLLFAVALFAGVSASAQTQKDSIVFNLKFTGKEFEKFYSLLQFAREAMVTSRAAAGDVNAVSIDLGELQKVMKAMYDDKIKNK